MNIQTEAMREEADKDYEAFEDDDGWHGIEYVNHLTPSGCDRWLPTYSDKRGWPDIDTAIQKIKEMVGQIPMSPRQDSIRTEIDKDQKG